MQRSRSVVALTSHRFDENQPAPFPTRKSMRMMENAIFPA